MTLLVLGSIITLLTLWRIIKGDDVRLILLGSALLLCGIAGKPLVLFDTFMETMGKGDIIGPICSAMGFAFVLRATGCDKEMVRLLITPLKSFKTLLIPGGCLVGFITNMAITSQTAAGAAVGSILIPVMLGAGFHPVVVGATLVLGCSAGGNLFNPGEPDIVNIAINTGVNSGSVISATVLPELVGFAIAVIALTFIAWKYPVSSSSSATITEQPNTSTESVSKGKVNIIKALLPPLPVLLLFLCMPQFTVHPFIHQLFPNGLPVPHAMIFSTMVVMLIHRSEPSKLTKEFFEGLGYGFVHVISLIISASCFIAALKLVGLIDALVHLVASTGILGNIASLYSTMGLAVISGSGTAPSVSFSKAVLPGIVTTMGLDHAVHSGILGAIGATFGRTMSPVAAIVIYASHSVGVSPVEIVKRTSIPLLIASVAVLLLITFRHSIELLFGQ